jgi:hypothetical protein
LTGSAAKSGAPKRKTLPQTCKSSEKSAKSACFLGLLGVVIVLSQSKEPAMTPRKKIIEEEIPNDDENLSLNPEDIDENQQSIEEAAYYIGLNRGRHNHPGDHLSDWLQAEKAVKEDLD